MTESGERGWSKFSEYWAKRGWLFNGQIVMEDDDTKNAWQVWQAAFEAGRGGLPVRKANDPILDVEIYLERDELLTLIDACDIYVFSDKLNDVRSQLHRQLPAPPDSGDAKKAKE